MIALCRLSPQPFATQIPTLLMAMVSLQLIDSYVQPRISASHNYALA